MNIKAVNLRETVLENKDENGIVMPPLESIPLNNLTPAGWLRRQLDLVSGGYFRYMSDISTYLSEDNGWLKPDAQGDDYQKVSWEEQAYWLRGAYKLALVTGDERLVRESSRYIEALFESVDDDGYFGPQILKNTASKNGPLPDIWPHMVMCEVMRDYYIATGDRRATEILSGFFRYLMTVPDDVFIPDCGIPASGYGEVQTARSCDMVPVILWIYGLTGEKCLVSLAKRFYERWENLPKEKFDIHGVHFAQRFRYQAMNYPFSGDRSDIAASEEHYAEHMSKWGQLPGGLLAADEQSREGKYDPRQGTETCTMTELVRSYNIMSNLTGDTKYADMIEDIMFNSFPAAFTPDYTALHYLTAANQPELDDKDHDYHNKGMWTRYSAFAYRCCQHNSAMGWPNFISSLFKKNESGKPEICAWTYAPCSVDTMLGGMRIKLRESTNYPFDGKVVFDIEEAEGSFTMRLRIPSWCSSFDIEVNGSKQSFTGNGRCIELECVEADDHIELNFAQDIKIRRFPNNGNFVCIDRGALTYSLKLCEKWTRAGVHMDRAGRKWYDWDVAAEKPYNYAVDISYPITVKHISDELSDMPFTPEGAPIVLDALCARVDGWGIGDDNTIMPVPVSPLNLSNVARKHVELVPLGCMRVRMSCLPYTENK